MEEIPIFDLGQMNAPSLSLGGGFLQIIFILSLIFAIIFTLVVFVHWKKYSPNPVKTFLYTITYTIGTVVLILLQITLLSIY